MKRQKDKKENLMERTRAAVALCNTQYSNEDMKLEAFMGLFHPEKQADRQYMRKLLSR